MKAYRISNYIIVAVVLENAKDFFKHEIGDPLPSIIEEMDPQDEISCDDGRTITIKEFINEVLDSRQQWLRMGVPCDILTPFIIKKPS